MSVRIDTTGDQRDVTLVKGAHTWRFRCAPGDEPELLDHAARLASLNDGFDWFDAAVLAHTLGECIAREIKTSGAGRPDAAPSMSSSPRPDAATGIGRNA